MGQKSANINLEGEKLSVVILPQATKLKGEWMFVFRYSIAELPALMSPMARAILFDILALSSVSVYGMLMFYPSDLLLRGISRTTLYRVLDTLEELEVVARTPKGLSYVNPKIAYRGRAQDWGISMEWWNHVRAKTQKEGGKDAK